MDELVLVRGLAELRPDNRTITVLRLEDIKRIPGVQGKGLDELRAEQGIEPLASAGELAGEPVADFDAFLELLRTAR